MLCVIPPNVIPSRDKLEASALNNPHGFGFAIVIPSENRIHCERTMNADTSVNRFLEMRAKYPEGYATWHARLATHGSMTVDNCHPFKVGHDERTYLAHNGILPIVEPQGDLRSDTRIFAEDLLPAIGGVSALDNDQVWNLLEDFTSGSKVVVLTVDPDAKHQCYLIHENKGKVDASGVWWSNDSCYLSSYETSWRSSKPLGSLFSKDDEEFWAECAVCDTVLLDQPQDESAADFCPTCGSCWMCMVYKTDCLCYQGSNSNRGGNWWNSDVQGGWGW
jgi:glutamine amidotransferase